MCVAPAEQLGGISRIKQDAVLEIIKKNCHMQQQRAVAFQY